VVGDMLLSMLKRADRVKTACISQLVNVNAPFMTEVGGAGSYRQTIFYPYMHASLYGRGVALTVPVECPRYDSADYSGVPYLSCAAVWNEEKEELTIFAINRSVSESMELSCDLRDFAGYRQVDHIILTDDDPKAKNTLLQPDRVAPKTDMSFDKLENGMFGAVLPKMSWNVLRFAK